jgi:DNA polymerase III subunit delta'
MDFQWDIVGHRQQILSLEKDLREGNVAHAYLFSGPKQSGKFRVARTFAGILQCPNHYCKICKDCQSVVAGAHPDTLFMKDDGESIKIEEVRELVRKTHLTRQGRYRVIAIENVERMPTEAQNSFLKTLEEPPEGTLFLLTTNHIDQVLLTIQSRVRHVPFSTVDEAVLTEYLVREFGERPEMAEAVNMAQGRPGLAISLIRNPAVFDRHKGLYSQIEHFLKRNDLVQKFQFVEAVEKDDQEIELFLDAFTRYLRKLAFDYLKNPAHPLSGRFTLRNLVNLFEFLEKTRYLIDRNVNKKLALENLMLLTEKN